MDDMVNDSFGPAATAQGSSRKHILSPPETDLDPSRGGVTTAKTLPQYQNQPRHETSNNTPFGQYGSSFPPEVD